MISLRIPKRLKKIVKRGVTELVTPGVSYNHLTINSKKNNFLGSIYYGKENIGISFLDISTGDFFVSEGNLEYINKLIQSFSPAEILHQKVALVDINLSLILIAFHTLLMTGPIILTMLMNY